jgi:hypothetical protein
MYHAEGLTEFSPALLTTPAKGVGGTPRSYFLTLYVLEACAAALATEAVPARATAEWDAIRN